MSKGISRAELDDALGYPLGRTYSYERAGGPEPPIEFIQRAAEFMGFDITEVLGKDSPGVIAESIVEVVIQDSSLSPYLERGDVVSVDDSRSAVEGAVHLCERGLVVINRDSSPVILAGESSTDARVVVAVKRSLGREHFILIQCLLGIEPHFLLFTKF